MEVIYQHSSAVFAYFDQALRRKLVPYPFRVRNGFSLFLVSLVCSTAVRGAARSNIPGLGLLQARRELQVECSGMISAANLYYRPKLPLGKEIWQGLWLDFCTDVIIWPMKDEFVWIFYLSRWLWIAALLAWAWAAAVSLMLHSISNFSTIFNLARVPTLQEMPHLNILRGIY